MGALSGTFGKTVRRLLVPDDDQPIEASSELEFCIRLVDGTVLKTFEDALHFLQSLPPDARLEQHVKITERLIGLAVKDRSFKRAATVAVRTACIIEGKC